jgi:hypothetical protein
LITQLVLAGRDVPQLLVSAKSPLAAMPEIVSVVVPLFVKVTVWEGAVTPTVWFPNERLEAESVTEEVLPVRFTTCGLPGALSATETEPLRIPAAVG